MVELADALWKNYLILLASPLLDTSRFFLPYIATALLIAYFLYQKRSDQKIGFFGWIAPKAIYQHPSAKNDLWLILLQPFILGVWAILLLPMASDGAAFVNNTLYNFLVTHFPDTRLEINWWSMSLFTILWLLVYDFVQFILHYIQHKVPFLWEFHTVHHSAEVLNPFTAYRFHPLEFLYVSILVVTAVSCIVAIFHWLFGQEIAPYALIKVHIGIFIFYFLGYNFRHSHIWLSYPRWLENILISPAMHQIHHSADPKHWDKNMGFIFSFWDRIFGTIYYGGEVQKLEYGLSTNQDKAYRQLGQLYMRPFVNIFKMVFKK